MKTMFPDDSLKIGEPLRKSLEAFKDLNLPQFYVSEVLKLGTKIDFPKFELPKETLASFSEATKTITSAYRKAVYFELPAMEFTQTLRTAMEAYNEQILNAVSLKEYAPGIVEALSSAISDSVISVADYYRSYMTVEQIAEIEDVAPEVLTSPEERAKNRPHLTLDQLLALLSIIVTIILSSMTSSQVNEMIDQNGQIIAIQEAQFERDAEQHEKEIAILSDLSSATQEMNELLQRIADALENPGTAADLVSQEPGNLVQPYDDVGELTDPVGHDGDTYSHDQNGDAEQPAAEP